MTTEEEFKAGLDFSNPLHTIQFEKLNADGKAFLAVNNKQNDMRNVQTVSSYNLSGTPDRPQIVVPGKPKSLVNWQGGQLQPDADGLVADENHHMMRKCPMQPLFVATKVAVENDQAPKTDEKSGNFKFQHFDFATDRINLRKLFKMLGNPTDRPDPFRMDIQLINNLICLIRIQNEDDASRSYKMFGKDFERQMSRVDDEKCCGAYFQIISCDFGSLKLLTRFKVDSADMELTESEKRKEAVLASKAKVQKKAGKKECAVQVEDKKSAKDPKDLADFLSQMTISSPSDPADGPLEVILHGDWRRYHMIEVGSRRMHGSFPEHIWAQLFFSHVPTFILGFYRFGLVKEKMIHRYTYKQVEEKSGGFPLTKVARLHDLLKKVAEYVRQNADEKDVFSIFWEPSFMRDVKIFRVKNPQRFAVSDGMRKLIAEN